MTARLCEDSAGSARRGPRQSRRSPRDEVSEMRLQDTRQGVITGAYSLEGTDLQGEEAPAIC